MKNKWFWILPVAALLAIALPGPAAQELAARKVIRAELLAAIEQEVARERELAQGATGFWFSDDDDRGWLGVSISEVTADKAKELKLPAERGVLLTDVEADSPAAKAGLKSGDVITEFNGQKVEGTAQFRRFVRETPAGRTVQLTYWRDGRSQTASVQLGQARSAFHMRPKDFNFHFQMPQLDRLRVMPELKLFSMGRPLLGIDAEDLSGQLGGYFGAPDGEGVLVRSVNEGSPAEKGGLKAGDVITQVNGERVKSVSDLREKLRAGAEKKTFALGVLRNRSQVTVNVEIEPPKPAVDRKRIVSRRVLL
jgi:S1-C subfamily serine protease